MIVNLSLGTMEDILADPKILINTLLTDAEVCFLKACCTSVEKVKEVLTRHQIDINVSDADGNNGLFYALYHDKDEIADYLVEQGINVNAQNHQGDTVLHMAVKTGYFPLIQKMVDDWGVNPDIKNDVERTAADWLIRNTIGDMDKDALHFLTSR